MAVTFRTQRQAPALAVPCPVTDRAAALRQRKPHTIPLLSQRQETVRGFPCVRQIPERRKDMSSRPYRVPEEGWLMRHLRLAAIVIAVCSAVLVALKSWPF